MNKQKTRAKIRRGIKLLDRTIPKWRQLVDIDKLDLSNIKCCPGGQVFGNFDNCLEVLNLYEDEADDHGFMILDLELGDKRYNSEYAKLTQLWKEELSGRGDRPGRLLA